MARGFGSTLGAGTTDSITLASFTMPSKISVWVRYLKNGTGGSGFGRLFEKPGPSTKEITLAISAATKLFIERDFSTTNAVWEFDDPQANTVGLWADVFFTYDDSSTSNVPLVWVNGRPVTVTTSTAPVGTAVNTSGVCHIGNRADSARNWDGIISKFAMWSTTGGYPEAQALLAGVDPFLIKPNNLIDYVDLSVPFVVSQKYRSALAVTGTKIRPDRLVTTQGRAFPFGAILGSGAMTGVGVAGVTASATLTGAAAVVSTATIGVAGASSLGGSLPITGAAAIGVASSGTLTVVLALTGAGVIGVAARATLAGTAGLVSVSPLGVAPASTLLGAGALISAGAASVVSASALTAFNPGAVSGRAVIGFVISGILTSPTSASIWTEITPGTGSWNAQAGATGIWTPIPPASGTWT